MAVSVIDLFSGPGGLSEGFSQHNDMNSFGPFVSVEMDPIACDTLRLRKLFHYLKFKKDPLLGKYYELIKSEQKINWKGISKDFFFYEDLIDSSVWEHELGTLEPKDTCKEIRKRLKRLGYKKSDNLVVIGGPPCQAYSLAGRTRRKKMTERGEYAPEKDERNFLYEWYLNVLQDFKPEVFIMENVPGILSSKINNNLIFKTILQDLEGCGYQLFPLIDQKEKDVLDYKIKCNLFGVAQSRERVIILGVREDCAPNKIPYLKAKEALALEDVIKDLPILRSGISKINRKTVKDEEMLWKKEISKGWPPLKKEIRPEIKKAKEKISSFQFKRNRGSRFIPDNNYGKTNLLPPWYVDSKLKGYLNHEARSHMNTDLRRYLFSSVFSKTMGRFPLLEDFPKKLLPEHKNKDAGIHKDRFRTLDPNKPSKTITSHIAKDGHAFIHYDSLQCRSLTVREAARIQSFPDNYFFCGNRTQQYHQVGNAVPPYLALQIAEVVKKILKKTNKRDG